ncbi:MAG: hypothetical protein HKO53_04545, partial [Gemmatimonadetes bacterium]|nr:hypothetical protein [Gemmatimonadota bacterium]
MRILALATALLALVLPLASPASANQNGSCPQVIDDFSQGALPPNNGPHDFTHVGLPPQSCLLGSRRVVVVGPERTGGMVNLGGGNIAFQATSTTPSGGQSVFDPNILLEYTTATPVDITAGGLNDRIIMDIAQWDEMSVFVYFEYLGGGTGKHLFPSSAGQLEILLSEFTFADFTQIKAIRFNFFEQSFNGESSMTVSRIRTEGSNLNILQFEVPELIEIGPPFPFPGPLMETFFVDDAGQLQQSISIFTTFQTAHVLPIGPFGPTLFPVQLASSDSGPGRARGFSAGFEMVEA